MVTPLEMEVVVLVVTTLEMEVVCFKELEKREEGFSPQHLYHCIMPMKRHDVMI